MMPCLNLVKKKIENFLISQIEDELFSLNKNLYLMKKLCEKHPELAIYAKGKALSLELMEIYLASEKDYNASELDLLKQMSSIAKEFQEHYYAIKDDEEISTSNIKSK